MKTGNYDLISILEYQGLEQFVIPEIQRDYVWQTLDVKDFLDYIVQGYRGDDSDKPYLGFIYAYSNRDHAYKYMLIDGQQRLTTIYLILLAVYQRIGRGLPDYMFNRQHLKIDYKVRQATQDFMRSLVQHCKKNPGSTFKVEDQIWYHREYSNDRTITNIINNYSYINRWIDGFTGDLSDFAQFMEEGVVLSYFNIDESRHGEDLYIYMNSRGRQLEPNETLKAKYLATTSEKERWGTEWEQWQDFFWKHKGPSRPDADAGFNDFLRMVQVISMSNTGKSSDDISEFIRAKAADPNFELLPSTVEELSLIFESYVWFVNAPMINSMFGALGHTEGYFFEIPEPKNRQIYFFRILPVISFLYKSACRDELTVTRIARFFYNLARKNETVGKDIGSQLPNAIRLMAEYGAKPNVDFDVCDLRNYAKGRTILIDKEEIDKLSIIDAREDDRARIEQLLWSVEDHKIFDGQISFLLDRHYDVAANEFDIPGFTRSWIVFQNLFEAPTLLHKVAVALLYYGNTWFQATPHYYQNYACMKWDTLVQDEKRRYLGQLIDDLCQSDAEIDSLIIQKIHEHFHGNGLTTVEKLKEETGVFQQIAILAAIDHYLKRTLFTGGNSYMAKNMRFNWGDKPFFKNSPNLFNVGRYVSEGFSGRLMHDMKEILQDEKKLQGIIDTILNQ